MSTYTVSTAFRAGAELLQDASHGPGRLHRTCGLPERCCNDHDQHHGNAGAVSQALTVMNRKENTMTLELLSGDHGRSCRTLATSTFKQSKG